MPSKTATRLIRNLSIAAVLCSGSAWAQSGQITGHIGSSDGSSIPDAAVTVTQIANGTQRTTKSNSEGYFTVPALLPGAYSVEVRADGFDPMLRKGLELQVEQSLRVDFAMRVGSVNQTVEVSSDAPILATETSSIGGVVSGKEVVDLPLLGRDAYALGELVPGVRGSIGMNNLPVDVISTASVSINGAQATANDFLLDGAPNSAPAQNQPVVYPIADAVQEFRVQTNNYSAQYGRSAGGIYDVVTKSGTNDLHFSGYEFYRSDTMAANNWFSRRAGLASPPLQFHQFGGVVGGPVVIPHLYDGRNKTFFFAGLEFVRFNQGVTFTSTVPDPVKLTGDFSHDVNSSGQAITIYNPFSMTGNASGAYTRQAFAGNVIPPGMINPVAAKMAAYFPKPNIANVLVNNYINNATLKIHENEQTYRLDETFNDRNRVFVRFSMNNTPEDRPNPYGEGNVGGPAYGPQVFNRYNTVGQYDHTFSSSLLGTLRASYARLTNSRTPASLGFDISSLGLPSSLADAIGDPRSFPVEQITGYSTSSSVANTSPGYALGTSGKIAGFLNTSSIQGNVVKTVGAHVFNVGTDLRLMRANILQTDDASTVFAFSPAFTQGPNASQSSAIAGDALASFLLGTPASGSVSPAIALSVQSKYSAVYLQDDWKVLQNLTLNLGLRYEYETPYTERYNRMSNFTPDAPVPLTGVANLHGALTFPGVNGQSRYVSTAYANHLEPRLGFAWHMFSPTVIHGGGGLFYDTLWGPAAQQPSNYGISGFISATSMIPSLDGFTPYSTLSDPYPTGLVPASGSSLGAATLLGQPVSASLRTAKTPYAAQWNLGVQQQLLKNMSLDMTYVGTQAHHEPSNLTLDQLPDSALSLGSALNAQVANPFYGQSVTGILAQPTVTRGQLLRPYPQFNGVTATNANWASARYNALEVMLQKKMSGGLSLQVAYTWSHLLDQGTGNFGGESLSGGGIQDYNNLSAEMSASSLDQTHRVVAAIVYQVPLFRNDTSWKGKLIGGWTVSALPSFISGGPLAISAASNTTGSLGGGQRPNWNGRKPALSGRNVSKWFDTSFFSAPAAYTFGNTPRTFNDLRSDRIRNVDLSLQKNTYFHEKLNLQLRVDAFNLTNTPTFAPPGTSFGAASFGVVSAQQNQPRVIQIGAKLIR